MKENTTAKEMMLRIHDHLGEGWQILPHLEFKVHQLVNPEKKVGIHVDAEGYASDIRCTAELYPLDLNTQVHFPPTTVSFAWNIGGVSAEKEQQLINRHIVKRLLRSDEWVALLVEKAEFSYRQHQRTMKAADRVRKHLASLGFWRGNANKNRTTGSITNIHTNGNPHHDFDAIRFAPGVVKVTEQTYDDAKCIMPPVYAITGNMWAMGEPVDLDDNVPTFYWFTEVDGEFFACYGTEAQATATFADHFTGSPKFAH